MAAMRRAYMHAPCALMLATDMCCATLCCAAERVVSNLSQYGNTSAASIPLALDEAVRRGDIKPGEVRCCLLHLLLGFAIAKLYLGTARRAAPAVPVWRGDIKPGEASTACCTCCLLLCASLRRVAV